MATHAIAGEQIKVISFNLRRDFGPQRKNRWESRKDLAARLIQDSGAQIIGVQESLPQMRRDLGQLLEGYSIFGKGRLNGAKPKNDEHSDIILRNEEVQLLSCRTVWISKKPDHPSRAYFAAFPRIFTVAEVQLKTSGARARVFNTHFDHICFLARKLGVQMILEEIERLNQQEPLPSIVMGDFNASPSSCAVRYLRQYLNKNGTVHLQNIYDVIGEMTGNTYHGFKGKLKANAKPIDYIFVSDEFEVVDAKVDTSSFDGQYPSDHFPIVATLRFKQSYLDSLKQKAEPLAQ